MVEVAIRHEPLHRMDAFFEETRPRCGSRREGRPRVRSPGRRRISDQRQNATGSPTQWSNKGFASQRRPKAGGILGARSVALLDQRENDSQEVNDRSMSHRDGSTCTSFIAHAVLALATSCWDVPVVTIHTELMSRALQCLLDQVKN